MRKVNLKTLPFKPGVYYMKDARGRVIYVGKAANLKRRVASYFQKAHDSRIEQLVSEVKTIDHQTTPSVLEALILEANEIRRFMPKYNIRERDDKSYLYLVFTKEKFSKPQLIRGRELKILGEEKFKMVFGPYISATSIRAALTILRKIFPYSICEPGQKRPCFYYHLKQCPGVCAGTIDARSYNTIIRRLGKVFAGKKETLLQEMERDMKRAAKSERFEEAGKLRNQIFALRHIRDVAMLTREERPFFGPPEHEKSTIDVFGRIEGYDISNISGIEAVGSMVVFEDGEPNKNQYRKFKIKTVEGANDVAMLKEVLRRRFERLPKPKKLQLTSYNLQPAWRSPDLLVIDGGWGQVHAVEDILREKRINSPIVGIAKGFNRKQDRPIYDSQNLELGRIVAQYKNILLQVRDEAHRFAISYHRKRMRSRLRTNN